MATKTDRIETRVSIDERNLIDRAAALEGRSVSSFVVAAAIDRADAVISAHNTTTVPVPRASASGMFRCGSRTSPAVKVMLFQASQENSEPT